MLTLAALPSHVEILSRELKELTALLEPTRTARRLWPSPLEQNSGLAMESTTCPLPEKAEKLISCTLRLSCYLLISSCFKNIFKTSSVKKQIMLILPAPCSNALTENLKPISQLRLGSFLGCLYIPEKRPWTLNYKFFSAQIVIKRQYHPIRTC